jgi:hypothetical protein
VSGVTKSEFLAFLDDVERGCEVTECAWDTYVSDDFCEACFYGAAVVRRGGLAQDRRFDAFNLADRYAAACLAVGINPELAIMRNQRSRESIAEELRIAAKDGRIPFAPEDAQ